MAAKGRVLRVRWVGLGRAGVGACGCVRGVGSELSHLGSRRVVGVKVGL